MAVEMNGNIGNSEDNIARRLHAVIIPYPAQGHVTPCLQLAKKLVALHGFRITFVNTTHIHERVMKSRSTAAEHDYHKDIEFVAVSDGLPEDHPRVHDLTALCTATLQMAPTFEDLITTLLRKSPITCIIRDVIFTSVHHVAKKFDIPVAAFVTSSAISMQCTYHLNTFISRGILPMPPPPDASSPSLNALMLTLGLPQSDAEAAVRGKPLTCLPGGSPTMRVEDIPTFLLTHDLENFFIRFFLEHQNPVLPEEDCVLYNTFLGLEDGVLINAVASVNDNVFAVGPLVLDSNSNSRGQKHIEDEVDSNSREDSNSRPVDSKISAVHVDGVDEVATLSPGVGSSMWEEDPVTLSWLDDQRPNSVLFVSFGSITLVSMEQMREFADGLEMSNVAFLWVVRPDIIDDPTAQKEFEIMLSEFVERTQDRALLVPWAPQTAVLSHPAIAAFLTHCGWNSTIESVSSGVPMLGWPRFSDQNTNCHYVTSVWKIGLELRSTLAMAGSTLVISKQEVAEKVRKIKMEMDPEIRRNCRNLQLAARKAVATGGSSQTALAKFVELIVQRSKDHARPSVNFGTQVGRAK